MLSNLVRDVSEPYENEPSFYSLRYLIVRKSDHLPLFDERFINYGYNKQQWVEHLRYIGYKFDQLVHGYGIDIPHPLYFLLLLLLFLIYSSKIKSQWAATITKSDKKPMKDVFYVFCVIKFHKLAIPF